MSTLMRARGVKELDVLMHDAPQMRLADELCPGTLPAPTGSSVKGCRKLLVVVADQKANVRLALVQLPHDLARLLGDPGKDSG